MNKNFISSLLILLSFNSANAGIATIDVTNIIQTTLSSIENMSQTAKQIEEYRTQLLQLEDQIKNTTGVNDYLWDQTDSTINQLINATDAIKVYSQQAGSLDAWLDKFGGDLGEYRNINCFQEEYANQFASQQSAQLLQIRSLMAQQNQALVARMQAENSREALQHASSENLRAGTYKESSRKSYTVGDAR